MKEAKGYTGTLKFDGSFVTIERKGLFGRISIGKGEKRIPVALISSVQWKPAGPFVNGYIEFSVGGGNESQSSFTRATADAVKNENAVVFTRKQMPQFSELRDEIENSMQQYHTKVS